MLELVARYCSRVWRSSLLFGGMAAALRVGAQLVLLPAIIFYLSPHDQAIWWVFVALGNFANLADFGFAQSIARIYNFLWAGADDFETEGLLPVTDSKAPNLAGIARLHQTVRRLYWWLSLGAATILAFAGTFYLFKAIPTKSFDAHTWFLWSLYLLTIGFNFSTGYWLLACQGINRVREVQIAYVCSSLLFLVVVFALLKSGIGLVAMVFGTAARALLLRQIARSTFCKVIPIQKTASKPDFSILRRIWPNARKLGLLSITGYWAANGLVLMSGYFLSIETTASIGATNNAGNFLLNFAALWLAVKWPQITVMRAQSRLQEMSALFARRLALALATFLIIAALIAVAGNAILALKHSPTRLIPAPYLIVYLCYLLLQFIYIQFATLVFTENVIPFCKISLLTCAAMVCLSLILIPRWGLWGLILSPLIAEAIFSAWIVIRRGFTSQSMGLQQFFRHALFGSV
jgi:O-antigen/teichoic acid export membrane protein